MQQHETRYEERRLHGHDDKEEGAFHAEHWLSWLVLAVSLVMGWIGLLRGFGILGGGTDQGVSTGSPGTQAMSFPALWDSAVWFLPAIALALVAFALHNTRHHRLNTTVDNADGERGLFKLEHGLAYLMAAGTIATAVLGLLVGFDVLGRGNDQPDALPWLFAAMHYGILTMALHSAGHHQVAEAPSYLTTRAVEQVSQPVAAPIGTHIGDTQRTPPFTNR